MATIVTTAVASTKLGTDRPSRPIDWPAVSRIPFGREAATTPSSTPAIEPMIVASSASSTVTGSADRVIDDTDAPVESETPRFPCRTLPIQETYCCQSGWSIP